MKRIQNVLNRIWKSIKNLFLYLFAFGKTKKTLSILEEEAIMSPTKIIIKNFRRNKLAMTGLIVFITLLVSIFALSWIIPLDISESSGIQKNIAPGMNYLNYPAKLEREGVVMISSGNSFSVGLSEAGNVYVWGVNTAKVKNIPQAVRDSNIIAVSAGSTHILALTDDNQLIGWGQNNHGQASVPEAKATIFQTDPIKKVVASDEFTVVLTQAGKLHVWGATTNRNLSGSYHITITKEIVDIAVGPSNVAMIYADGTANVIGPIMLAIPNPQGGSPIIPEQIRKLPVALTNGSVRVTKIQLIDKNGIALDENGNTYVWGDDSTGITDFPTEATTNIAQIGAGRRHVVVLTEDGKLITWGDNTYRQLNMTRKIENGTFTDIFVTQFQSYALYENGKVAAWGNRGFFFGTDEWGRDVFTRIIHGGRISLIVGAVAVLISSFIGVTIGMISGFYGKMIDMLLMRFAEIVASFPFLPLAITLSVAFGGQLTQNERLFMIMVILGVLSWTGLARLVRGQILSEREKDFVLAAKATGIKERHIITRHILPNIINIVIVSMTLGYAGSLLTEAGLSYLGFGVVPPSPSWGNMLNAAQSTDVMQNFWWRWMIPGFAVITAALSINLVGDGLREAMDPKANER
ncbi:MAG TPA: ABC transporter permease subunit [Bacilli bacterium]|nr:ABC transporter permease subunit [Bacilli bacterium]